MGLGAFTAPGRFYRGNLHTHSNVSDGILDPKEVCRRYKAEGYDFISLTDHFVGLYGYPITDTEAFRDPEFTTILGAESHSGKMENGELWHLLTVGLPKDFAPSNSPDFFPIADQESGPELARRAREAGAFVAIAHPQWSGMTMHDARSIDAAHAIEVYNHSCAVDAGRGEGFHTAELLLSEGRNITLIATDDAHFSAQDAFGGWVMVKASELTPEALLQSLKDGHFYGSQGPELHDMRIEGDRLLVESSAVSTVVVQGRGSAAKAVHGESLTRTVVPLDHMQGSPWIRVTVLDRGGKAAWSNPIWIDT